MKELSFADVFDLKQGHHLPLNELHDDCSYDVFGANGIVGKYDKYMYEKPTVLVTCRGATCGSINLTTEKSWVTGNAIALNPKVELDDRFIYYQLKGSNFYDVISGSAQPQIIVSTLKRKKIKIPDLKTQQEIAQVLEQADKACQQRKGANALTDQFLQSSFLSLFGDPVKNEKGWKLKEFGAVSESRLGKMLDQKKQTGKYRCRYLGNSNVKWGDFDLSNLLEMDFDEGERQTFSLKIGDLLICEGGEVGRTAIWKGELDDCYFQKALHRIRLHPDKAAPEYILYLMWFLAHFGGFRDFVTSATIPHLTGIKLKTMKLPLPPLSLQQQFASIVNQAEQLRLKQKESERELENLFQGLLQRYFG